jgi:dTDP-4-dehydrorhamnose reductase
MNLGLIGANSNVGTELCFLLKNDLVLKPIIRNKLGSIFLNHHGFKCHLSDVSKNSDAQESLSDLDSIVISSYATDPFSDGQTRSSQIINEEIIKNTIEFSKKNSTIIYFSTIRAFSNNIVPNSSNFLIKANFEKEKIHLEKLLLSESKKQGKRAFVLRMSQVFGNNQPRTHIFKKILSKKKVIVQVSPKKISNIVHTISIKNAIMKCLDYKSTPGVYSLVNTPQWTWSDVIDYYKKPQTLIEYRPQVIINNETKIISKNNNSFAWNLLKSNKKFIKSFLYYVSPKYEPQIQKKLTTKRISTAISNFKKDNLIQENESLRLSQIQKYKNSKVYLDDIIKNKTSKFELPEGLKDYSQDEDIFNIEEFNFKSMPGPFLDELDNTENLLKNNNFDSIFN